MSVTEKETIVPLDGWQVVAVLGEGTFVTDGDVFFRVGGHSTDESAYKKLEREYARIYNDTSNSER